LSATAAVNNPGPAWGSNRISDSQRTLTRYGRSD
jgi:hypothetical protein